MINRLECVSAQCMHVLGVASPSVSAGSGSVVGGDPWTSQVSTALFVLCVVFYVWCFKFVSVFCCVVPIVANLLVHILF